MAGQSNAGGKGLTSEVDIYLPENIVLYCNGQSYTNNYPFLTFGVDLPLARSLGSLYTETTVIILKHYVNGSSIVEWVPGGPLYQSLLDAIDQVVIEHPEAALKGFIWIHGETDARNTVLAGKYSNRLTTFFNSLRRNYPVTIYIPLISSERPCTYEIQQAQLKKRNNVFLISTWGLSYKEDKLHYDTEGIIVLSDRILKEIIK